MTGVAIPGPCYPDWPATSPAFANHRLDSGGLCTRCGGKYGEPDRPDWKCAAGRTAFFHGAWTEPCELPTEHQHHIITGIMNVDLCDTHFAQVNAAGLVTDPYITRDAAEQKAVEDRRRLARGKGIL